MDATASYGDPRVPDRFWQRVHVADSGCWEWDRLRPDGYADVSLTQALQAETGLRRSDRAHRLFYRLLVGPLPSGHDWHLDHLCRNRACCRPSHLELVSARVNVVERSHGPVGRNLQKTECARGHDLTDPTNVRIETRPSNGRTWRRCMICRAIENSGRGAAAPKMPLLIFRGDRPSGYSPRVS